MLQYVPRPQLNCSTMQQEWIQGFGKGRGSSPLQYNGQMITLHRTLKHRILNVRQQHLEGFVFLAQGRGSSRSGSIPVLSRGRVASSHARNPAFGRGAEYR